MEENVKQFLSWVKETNPGESEFLQAVEEVAEAVLPMLDDHPRFNNMKILERMVEPERVISFRVPWLDDNGNIQVNRGYRIEMNSAIGPYKGGLRFHPSVNLSILKFLAFEQVFKNALTTLPMGWRPRVTHLASAVCFANVVRNQIINAIKDGATAHIDATSFPQDKDAYLMPQILTNVTHNMDIMCEESFGPVVGIMSVKDDAEAVMLMNDSKFGLTASIWTRDQERAEKIADQIETGTVFMNRADYLDPGLCWTGCKDTGRGGGLSVIGYHNLTRPKSYHLKKL